MRYYTLLILCFITTLFLGCHGKSGDGDPFGAMNFDAYDVSLNKRVEAYQSVTFPNLANEKVGNPSLYIDFSSGINKAFIEPTNKDLISKVYNALMSDQLDVYKLGSKIVEQIPDANPLSIGQMLNNASEYKDIYAPITKAVDSIVAKNNDACLITDYEEYDLNSTKADEITQTAFLKIPFSNWLAKGNTIHFFVSNFNENGVEKHLYFTIFNCGNPSKSSMILKVENILSKLHRFDLSNKSYKLSQEYETEKTGGIFYDATAKSEKKKNLLDLNKETYINGLQNNNNFEFYQFGLDWATIGQLHDEYQKENLFKDFFRKLFIDLSNEDAYSIEDIDVKVYDVSEDFENFAKCNEVLKHKPKLEKGSNGEDKFSDTEKDNIALSCYDTKGKIKDDWVYKSKPNKPVAEIFSLNKELFKNTKTNDKKKVELAVSFDSKFNVKKIDNPKGLIRVDIIISNTTANVSNPNLDLFKWFSAVPLNKGKLNTALVESIKNTLTDEKVKPVNKTIYSYYIKTLQ